MYPTFELAMLYTSIYDISSQLKDVFDTQVDELEGEILEEFQEMYEAISTQIENAKKAVNVLESNGFVWKQRHTNEINVLIASIVEDIDSPEQLFQHIKKFHRKSEKYQCTEQTCVGMKFSDFSNFKKHVIRCFGKRPANEERPDVLDPIIPPELFAYAIDDNVLQFESSLNRGALELACSLAANMSTPRCEVYSTIDKFKKYYLTRLIRGIKKLIQDGGQDNIDKFIDVVESSFDRVKNEDALDQELLELRVYTPLTQCEIYQIVKNERKHPRKRQKRMPQTEKFKVDGSSLEKCDDEKSRKRSYESDDDDDYTEANVQVEHKPDSEYITIKGDVTLMPIVFQIRKFLEMSDVMTRIIANTERIMKGKGVNHFIKGKLCDGAVLNNPLGPHAKSGEEQFNYYSFPTDPGECQSRLQNIFVGQIYPDYLVLIFRIFIYHKRLRTALKKIHLAKYHKIFSVEKLYNNIIDVLISLAEDGILINVNGEQKRIYFVLGLFISDNKEANQRLGYVGSFTGKHCCRYCKTDIVGIRKNETCDDCIMRNRENYDKDVAAENVTETGVSEYSPFNRIPGFHVTESSAIDLTHNLSEGSLHVSLTNATLHFMDKKYFDLDYLNNRLQSMKFGKAEQGNKPVVIQLEHIKKSKNKKDPKFKMTASEMYFFTHHYTLLIGNRVPDEDPVWQHVLKTIKFFDVCFLPSYNDNQLDDLSVASVEFNRGIKVLFGETLRHKSHLSTHYRKLTEDFGPLRDLQTIRFEGKHKKMKNYAKNTNSRLNLPFSIGKKTQYSFALRLLKDDGLDDRITVHKYTVDSFEEKEYFESLTQCKEIGEILSKKCYFTKEITVNGIIFSSELWLPIINEQASDGLDKICEVVDLLMLDLNDTSKMFVICKTYNVIYERHFECYSVDYTSVEEELAVLNIKQYLSQHQYPVKIHCIDNSHLFRRKQF